MKIFLTEIDDPFNDKKYVGPYIKALSIEEAQKILDKETANESAVNKLKGLGLTDEEIEAFRGN